MTKIWRSNNIRWFLDLLYSCKGCSMVYCKKWSSCILILLSYSIFIGLLTSFVSTIDMKYALAPQTPIPESDICPIGLGRSTNVLQVIYPDSRTGNEPNRPGNCSYSYQLKPCREIWGEKLCTQANDRYGRRPGSLHIVIGIVFNTSVDGNSLRPGPGKQGTVTVISCCVPGGPYVDIDIRPDMTHPNFIYNIVSLKPYTSPDVLGVCRAHFFGLLLIGNPDSPATSIRGSGGSVLDGNYDGVPGGTYQMRFLPPPC